MHELGEVAGVEDEEARRQRDAYRVHVDLRHRLAEVGVPGAGVDAALAGAADLDVVGTHPPRGRDLAVEQDVQAGSGITLAEEPARLGVDDLAVLAQPLQLGILELLEEEERAQLVDAAPLRGLGRDSSCLFAQLSLPKAAPGSDAPASLPSRLRRRLTPPASPTRNGRRRRRIPPACSSRGGTAAARATSPRVVHRR